MAVVLNDFSEQVTTVVNVFSTAPITIYSMIVLNTTSAIAYIQMFRAPARNVTLGTTTPGIVLPLPPSSGLAINMSDGWHIGGNGLCLGATTTRTGSSTAACDIWIAYNPGAVLPGVLGY